MLLTTLVVIAALVVLGLALAGAFALAVRRPALLARMMRVPVFRRVLARMATSNLRRARTRAGAAGARMTDLELALVGQDGREAEQARAMLARMNPRQRAELSRRTLGADGLAAMMETAATLDDDAVAALGRADRRRAGGLGTGAPASRTAQQRKAIAKRRSARKAKRR
jgi:hypothetical protein